jgi:hypothetical protein
MGMAYLVNEKNGGGENLYTLLNVLIKPALSRFDVGFPEFHAQKRNMQ